MLLLGTAFAAVLGLAIGSFLNVVICRVPLGESVISPPSRCPRCDHGIRNRHNVPVLGWLMLRGRCYDCSEPISARYPLVEALTGTLFAAVAFALLWAGAFAALPGAVALVSLGVVLVAVASDRQKLPALAVLIWGVIAAILFAVPAALSAGTVAWPSAAGGAVLVAVCGVVAMPRLTASPATAQRR